MGHGLPLARCGPPPLQGNRRSIRPHTCCHATTVVGARSGGARSDRHDPESPTPGNPAESLAMDRCRIAVRWPFPRRPTFVRLDSLEEEEIASSAVRGRGTKPCGLESPFTKPAGRLEGRLGAKWNEPPWCFKVARSRGIHKPDALSTWSEIPWHRTRRIKASIE